MSEGQKFLRRGDHKSPSRDVFHSSNPPFFPSPNPPGSSSSIIGDVNLYNNISEILYLHALPMLLAFGFFGNLMNLLILTGKRIQHSLRSTEKATNTGLIALAVSDLAFCISAFPSTFLPADMSFQGEPGFMALYACYSAAVISIFIMTSTWLTVAMSAERYLAICHPLGSRRIISLNRTRVVIILVNILSILFNIPLFWRYVIITKDVPIQPSNISKNWSHITDRQFLFQSIDFKDQYSIGNKSLTAENKTFTLYQLASNTLLRVSGVTEIFHRKSVVRARVSADDAFEHAYRIAWAMFGNLIPLLLLVFCNVGLLKEIQKSYALRRHMSRSVKKSGNSVDLESSQRITMTLVCIVVMFLILVAPSEIVKLLASLCGADLESNYHFKSIEVATNFMQAVNFSANFILYCIVNPSFRRTMKEMLRLKGANNNSNKTSRPPSISSARVVGHSVVCPIKPTTRIALNDHHRPNHHHRFMMNSLLGRIPVVESALHRTIPDHPCQRSKICISTTRLEIPGCTVDKLMRHSYS